MDNDNKIKPPAVRGTSDFLKEDPALQVSKVQLYSLDSEFAKTKNNKSLAFYLLFIGFLCVVIGGTIFLTIYIQNLNQRMEIKISDFDELNLKDLLNASRKNYGDLLQLKQDVLTLKQQMKGDLAQAQIDVNNSIKLIKEKGLSPDDENTAIKQANDEGSKKIAAVRDNYQSQIDKKQNEINLIQKNLGQYDQKMMDAAKKSEQVLEDTQKLSELELNKQKKIYEDKMKDMEAKQKKDIQDIQDYNKRMIDVLVLKYNPVITDKKITNLLNSKIDPSWKNSFSLKNYSGLLGQERILSESDFNGLRGLIGDYDALISRLYKVPYTNSIPTALAHLDYISGSIVQNYDDLWNKMAGVIQKKNNMIDSYRFALDAYSKINRENGYVVDPRDTNRILVYIDKIYNIKNDDSGIVFRNEDETIATIKFYQDFEGIKAKIGELYGTNQIQPFDKILIKLK